MGEQQNSAISERQRKIMAAEVQRKDLSKTLKNTRHKLTSSSDLPFEFDRDLLFSHARNYKSTQFVIPALAVFIAVVSLNWNFSAGVFSWLGAVLLTHCLVLLQNHRLLKDSNHSELNIGQWYTKLVCSNLMSGIVWSSYLIFSVSVAGPTQAVFIFSVLLMVIAIYTFITAPIYLGMLAATTPITLVVMAKFSSMATTSLVIMAGLFIASQLMFIVVGRHVRNSLVRVLQFKAEKDAMIVDLEEATAMAEEARRRSDAANLAKSRFLATMSHELRTPLNAILGFSEIMKGEVLGPLNNKSYVEYVSDIHSSGQHLLNLINEILDLSRIEAGKYELSEQPVDLIEIVEDCHGLIELRAKGKDISVEIKSEPDMSRIWADERAIRQIVLNLLSNAVKFNPQGGEIKIAVGKTRGGGQYVSVTDTGPGIPEDEIPIVLSQFGQGSSSIKSAEQGTGLGLPIVQALVNMHGGIFDLRSKLRTGTRVMFSLPADRVIKALAPMKDPTAPNQEVEYQDSRRYKRAS